MSAAPASAAKEGWTSRVGLRTRVTVAFALGAMLLSLGFAGLTYELARAYLLRQRETSVLRQTYANASLVRSALLSPQPDIPKLLTSVELPVGSSPLVLHGGVWFGASVAVGPESIPEALRRTVMDGTAGRQRYVRQGVPQLAVGIPMPALQGAYFEVFPLSELVRTLAVLRNSLAAAAVATTLAGATVGRVVTRRVLAPVAQVSAAAVAIADGRFDVRLDEAGDPDLSGMAVAFNRMTDALQARIQRDARFASDVSHELRSPLTTLAAALHVMVARRDDLPARAREGLDLLNEEVARFERLVEDLVEISRIDAGVEEMSVDEVLLGEFVLQSMKFAPGDAVPIEIAADVSGVVVLADKRRLERVLANLIGNARVHGGGVEAVRVERRGDWARVSVEDSGPGVPAADRERIFERFARGGAAGRRGSGDGTGLGLSLVREHVRLHGGHVSVEPREVGGARFVVELPVLR